jgi:hypothetical protein
LGDMRVPVPEKNRPTKPAKPTESPPRYARATACSQATCAKSR